LVRAASGTSASLYAVTWDGSRFVAVGESGTILVSPEGTVWSRAPYSSAESLQAVTAAGGRLLVWGAAFPLRGILLTSTDASTWTGRVTGLEQSVASVAWTGSEYLAVGATGLILASDDGMAWTARTSGTRSDLRAFAVSTTGSTWVAVGTTGTILTSPDART